MAAAFLSRVAQKGKIAFLTEPFATTSVALGVVGTALGLAYFYKHPEGGAARRQKLKIRVDDQLAPYMDLEGIANARRKHLPRVMVDIPGVPNSEDMMPYGRVEPAQGVNRTRM